MKKVIALFISSLLILFFSTITTAQTCCAPGTTAPEVTTGFYTTSPIAGNNNTPAPVLFVNASTDLPTVEYIVTKRGTLAVDGMGQPDTTGGGGDVVLGVDVDGIFMPQNMTRYGVTLVSGDTFDITAIGYDLPVIQLLMDSLLNGKNANGNDCCDLFGLMALFLGRPAIAGFCDSVNNAGIYTSADINSMNDILNVFDVFSEGSLSIGNIVFTLELINGNGTYITPTCGGTGANNFVPYGVNRNAKYGYELNNVIAVRELSAVSSFMIFPNPANAEDVTVYFTTKQTVNLIINVVDAMGKTVYQAAADKVQGNISTTIPVGELPAGLYVIELTDGKNNQTQKLIVK